MFGYQDWELALFVCAIALVTIAICALSIEAAMHKLHNMKIDESNRLLEKLVLELDPIQQRLDDMDSNLRQIEENTASPSTDYD